MPYHHIIITLLLLLFTNTQAQVNYTLTGTTASKHSKIALYKGFGLNKHNTFIQLEKDKVVKAIVDNEDTEDEEIIEIIEGEDGYFDVLGSTEIDKIERLFGIELEDDDYTTIAGLVTSEAGHVPKVGEILNIRGLEIKVKHADDKKLALLRIRRHTSEDSENSDFQE